MSNIISNQQKTHKEKFYSFICEGDVMCHLIVSLLAVSIRPELKEKRTTTFPAAAVEKRLINLHNKNINTHNRLAKCSLNTGTNLDFPTPLSPIINSFRVVSTSSSMFP